MFKSFFFCLILCFAITNASYYATQTKDVINGHMNNLNLDRTYTVDTTFETQELTSACTLKLTEGQMILFDTTDECYFDLGTEGAPYDAYCTGNNNCVDKFDDWKDDMYADCSASDLASSNVTEFFMVVELTTATACLQDAAGNSCSLPFAELFEAFDDEIFDTLFGDDDGSLDASNATAYCDSCAYQISLYLIQEILPASVPANETESIAIILYTLESICHADSNGDLCLASFDTSLLDTLFNETDETNTTDSDDLVPAEIIENIDDICDYCTQFALTFYLEFFVLLFSSLDDGSSYEYTTTSSPSSSSLAVDFTDFFYLVCTPNNDDGYCLVDFATAINGVDLDVVGADILTCTGFVESSVEDLGCCTSFVVDYLASSGNDSIIAVTELLEDCWEESGDFDTCDVLTFTSKVVISNIDYNAVDDDFEAALIADIASSLFVSESDVTIVSIKDTNSIEVTFAITMSSQEQYDTAAAAVVTSGVSLFNINALDSDYFENEASGASIDSVTFIDSGAAAYGPSMFITAIFAVIFAYLM